MIHTFIIFQLDEIEYWDQYPEDYGADAAEALEEFNELNNVEWTREQFMEYLRGFKQVYSEVSYEGGDPTNTVVVHHVPTNTYWKGQHFWDSWGGEGSFRDPYTEHPVLVELRPVTRNEWVEVE